jgi:hypothetical protein
VDRYPPIVRVQLVDPYDNTHKCGVQRAVGLEIGRHIDAHSEYVMTCLSREIQTVLRDVQRCAIFWWQVRVEGANADGLRQIHSWVKASFSGLSQHEDFITTELAVTKVTFSIPFHNFNFASIPHSENPVSQMG